MQRESHRSAWVSYRAQLSKKSWILGDWKDRLRLGWSPARFQNSEKKALLRWVPPISERRRGSSCQPQKREREERRAAGPVGELGRARGGGGGGRGLHLLGRGGRGLLGERLGLGSGPAESRKAIPFSFLFFSKPFFPIKLLSKSK